MNATPSPQRRLVLSLCDFSGDWPRPYAEAGYDVLALDIKHDPARDVRLFELPARPVHGVLAAPVCTMFANSGARWVRTDEQMREALALVDACIRIAHMSGAQWWALENPVGKLRRWLGPPRYIFNPCDHGDPYTKRTCLWGDFTVPERSPVEPTEGSKMWKLYGGKSERTKTARSMTPPGFARAFFEANP